MVMTMNGACIGFVVRDVDNRAILVNRGRAVAMGLSGMLDRVARRMPRMRTGDRDQAGEDGADQRQEYDGLIHALALHQIDVFDRDRTAVAEINHQHGKPDRRFRRRHRQHQQRKYLAHDVAEEGGERHQVDVDREQDQFDRHEDDDDVLAVEEDAENPKREQDRTDSQIVSETDGHFTPPAASASCRPCPAATLRTLMASSGVRAFCTLMSCRLTEALWRKVSTMAPIMATSSTMPASWK